jgi:uncharacterized protein YjbJ (UPF0337 family)
MNWKLLLVIAGLTLTTSITACSQKDDAAAPDTKAPETSAPADAMKSTGDAVKDGAGKATDAVKDGAGKATDAVKEGTGKATDAVKGAGDAMKPATGTKPADAPKKP